MDDSEKMDVDEEGDGGDQNGDHEDDQEAGEDEEDEEEQEARYQEDENYSIHERECEDVSEVEVEAEEWEEADDENEDDEDEDNEDEHLDHDQDEEHRGGEVEHEYEDQDQDEEQDDDQDMHDFNDDECRDDDEDEYGRDEDGSDYHYSTEQEMSSDYIYDGDLVQPAEVIESRTRTIGDVLTSARLPLSLQKSASGPALSKKKGSLTKIVDKVAKFCKKALPGRKGPAKKEKVDIRNPPIPPWAMVYEEGGKMYFDLYRGGLTHLNSSTTFWFRISSFECEGT